MADDLFIVTARVGKPSWDICDQRCIVAARDINEACDIAWSFHLQEAKDRGKEPWWSLAELRAQYLIPLSRAKLKEMKIPLKRVR